jgi:hypothetical protein
MGKEFIPYPHPTSIPYPKYTRIQQKYNNFQQVKYHNFQEIKYNNFQQINSSTCSTPADQHFPRSSANQYSFCGYFLPTGMRVWVLLFDTRTRHTRWVKDFAQ